MRNVENERADGGMDRGVYRNKSCRLFDGASGILTVLSQRQREVLDLYLDAYLGRLTVKNWAKLVKVSPDMEIRDIQDLVEKHSGSSVRLGS